MRHPPRLLDLFCGAGGAGVGYWQAGYSVVGVDVELQPEYPFPMVVADALEYLRRYGTTFDVIHASPPCQTYSSTATMHTATHPDLVEPTRRLLVELGKPWIIENVPGAPLAYSVLLCGSMFGLGTAEHGGRQLRRHRLFETSFPMLAPTCQHDGETIGIYGDHAWLRRSFTGPNHQLDAADSLRAARDALGMPWVTRWHGLAQAIPPAYTRYLGEALHHQLQR